MRFPDHRASELDSDGKQLTERPHRAGIRSDVVGVLQISNSDHVWGLAMLVYIGAARRCLHTTYSSND
jgi:hypothetical protein